MKQKIPVENKTAMPMYVAGVMIPPGEIRHFDRDQVPSNLWPVDAPAAPVVVADPLLAILDGNVQAVASGLAALAVLELSILERLESENKNRKGVFEAIEAERLRRAQAAIEAVNGDGGGDEGTAG